MDIKDKQPKDRYRWGIEIKREWDDKKKTDRERHTHTHSKLEKEREKKNGKFTKIFFNEISEST